MNRPLNRRIITIRPAPATRCIQFDSFGFASLSLFVGALQLLMDRGQPNDWFSATETYAESVVMVVALTYFVAQTALTRADQSFLDHRLLKNGNNVTGPALTPTTRENPMGSLFAGFASSAVALWQMTHYSLVLSESDIVWPGELRGVGVGLVFVPLSAAAFSTLDPTMRAQGTAIRTPQRCSAPMDTRAAME